MFLLKIFNCYCPRCFAEKVENLSDDEIISIGTDLVLSYLEHAHNDISIKINRDLNIISKAIKRVAFIAKNNNKSKDIEDMSREELIAELKKRNK